MPQKSLRVKSRFEASENISQTARKIEKNTRKLNRSMKRGFRESARSALNFKGVLKSILAAGAIQKGFGLLSQGIRKVSTEFIDFGNTTTEAALKFGDIGPRAENFNEKLKEIEASARRAGALTKFTAPQAAQALLLMAKGGFSSAEAMGALRGQIDFAIASGEEFELSTRISTKLLGAFGLNVKNTEQKIENLNLVNDTLTATVNNSSIGLEELFDAMKDVGPVARNLNTDIVDVAAMAGVLGKEGLDATKAMTGMRSLFLNLAAPSTQGAQILKALGLTLDSGAVKAKNMTGFLFELTEATKDFSQTERAKVFRGIFGKTGIAAATILTQGAQKVDDFKQKIIESRGEVALMSGIMQTTLKGRILELGSTMTEFGFKILDPFEKKIKDNVMALTELFRKKDTGGIIESINAVLAVTRFLGNEIGNVLGLLDKLFEDKEKPGKKEEEKLFRFPSISELFTRLNKGELIQDIISPKLTADLRRRGFDPSKSGLLGLLVPDFTRETELQRNKEFKKLFPLEKALAGQQGFTESEQKEIQPEFTQPAQPNLNVNIDQKIGSKEIEVETEVEAPGTSGKVGVNKF